MHIRGLVYFLLALSSATLAAGAAALIWFDYESTLRETGRRADAAVEAYAVHASRNLGELRYGVEWLIRNVAPTAPDYEISPAIAEAADTLARSFPGMSALAIIGADARIRFSTVTHAVVGMDVGDRDYFAAVIERGEIEYIGEAVPARAAGPLVYTLSRRLEHNGRFSGIAVAAASIPRWNDIVAPLVPLPGSFLRLLRADGSVIVAQRTRPGDGRLETVRRADRPAIAGIILARAPVAGSTLLAEVAIPRKAALARWETRRTRIIIGAATGLLALLVFTCLAERALRREAAAARALEARTEELHRAVEGEKLLMAELQHRVKNSLSLAAGMLYFERAQAADEEARSALDRAQARILAIARVHDRLLESASPSSVSLDVYLAALCTDVAANAGILPVVDADAVVLPSAQAVSLGLIVTELLLNAAKHAGTGPDARVDVNARLAGGILTLTVRDYGRGTPTEFQGIESSGLGMRIVSSLLTQLDGRLAAENAEPGLRFVIRVPLESPTRMASAPPPE